MTPGSLGLNGVNRFFGDAVKLAEARSANAKIKAALYLRDLIDGQFRRWICFATQIVPAAISFSIGGIIGRGSPADIPEVVVSRIIVLV